MPAKPIELKGTFQREQHRWDDTIVAEVEIDNGNRRELASLKGTVPEATPLTKYHDYLFFGYWGKYNPGNGTGSRNQFNFKTYVEVAPHSRAGIISYLSNCEGIGRAIAGQLFDKFGDNAVRILREEPDIAEAACRSLSSEVAASASKLLRERQGLENVTIEMVTLLHGRGFREAIIKQAIMKWGNRGPEMIKLNPYLLMRFPYAGFKLTDALYLHLGKNPSRLKRQTMCGWHSLRTARDGSTWHWVGKVKEAIRHEVGASDVEPDKAIRLGLRADVFATTYTSGPDGPPAIDGDILWLAEAGHAQCERRVAHQVASAMKDGEMGWPVYDIPELSPHQSEQLTFATASGSIGILDGCPGTGKTYTAACYIRELVNQYGAKSIYVCAPTGKAAVRIKELLNSQGLSIGATTIHRALEVESVEDAGWVFKRHRNNPLPCRFIIVDESSMISLSLMDSLLEARNRGTKILFLGDTNQLAPVEHGAPLRDMIAAGVPCGTLTEIRRNAGGIVRACKDIRDGLPFTCEDNLALYPGNSPSGQAAMIQNLLERIQSHGRDPVWECQVLVAVNKGSLLSRKEMNKVLQLQLNRNLPVKGTPFRLADKVVNTKNRYFPPVDRGEDTDPDIILSPKGDLFVANGEIGEVVFVAPRYMHVALTGPQRTIVVPRGMQEDDEEDEEKSAGTGCDWDLGYALSVHKFQGSEQKLAIVAIDENMGANMVCDRSWYYTGISRAKERCALVGRLDVAIRRCQKSNLARRKTFLQQLIREELRER